MFTLGTLKLWLTALGVGVLLFLSVWAYKKLKKVWYDKGMSDRDKTCIDQLIALHNSIASGRLPDGVRESDKTWGLPTNKPEGGVESKDADASGK
jgi:hypothetical protein